MLPSRFIPPMPYAIPHRELTLNEREAMAEPRHLPPLKEVWERINLSEAAVQQGLIKSTGEKPWA